MPHNLYLHSSLVQTRKFDRSPKELRKAIRFNILDSTIALNIAFLVNAAILILAASTFYKNGLFEVAEIQDAHKLLAPMLGTQLAPVLFAVALIAAGQSSTITGTLAGQIVMEGYLNLRIQPWIRRLITRLIAIIPALLVIQIAGESATGKLLVLSQVILSLQLGFAIIPLIHFVSDKKKMGEFTIKPYIKIMAWISAGIIVSLNAKLVYSTLQEWIHANDALSPFHVLVILIALFCGLMLLYISLMPLLKKGKSYAAKVPHGSYAGLAAISPHYYKRIAITLDFSKSDSTTISHALAQGGKQAEYLLIHVVETVGAIMLGQDVNDLETGEDKKNLELYAENIKNIGYQCQVQIGFGNPKSSIPQMVKDFNADLLVMGAHGHKGFMDMILGTTLNTVRHRVNIPVLIVR